MSNASLYRSSLPEFFAPESLVGTEYAFMEPEDGTCIVVKDANGMVTYKTSNGEYIISRASFVDSIRMGYIKSTGV